MTGVTGAAKRLTFEILGWTMLLAGIAAIFLPGPGLLLMFGGLALLSQSYTWAERWVEPIRLRALEGAAQGVATGRRIVASTLGALVIGGFGVVWLVSPPAPDWWPFRGALWLLGGPWTGITLLISCVIALALLLYSYRRFHGNPEAVAALRAEIVDADEDRDAHRPHLRHGPGKPEQPGDPRDGRD